MSIEHRANLKLLFDWKTPCEVLKLLLQVCGKDTISTCSLVFEWHKSFKDLEDDVIFILNYFYKNQ